MRPEQYLNDDHSKFASEDYEEDRFYGPYDVGQDDLRGHYEFQSDGFGQHEGHGPKNYKRSDERLLDEANIGLTRSHEVDASHIHLSVFEGIITLRGYVRTRAEKRAATDVMESLFLIEGVRNELQVKQALS